MENTQWDGSQAKENIDSVQSGIFWEDKKMMQNIVLWARFCGSLFPWYFITDNITRISCKNVLKQAW